jgi:hypothetical protein
MHEALHLTAGQSDALPDAHVHVATLQHAATPLMRRSTGTGELPCDVLGAGRKTGTATSQSSLGA